MASTWGSEAPKYNIALLLRGLQMVGGRFFIAPSRKFVPGFTALKEHVEFK